MKVAFDENVPAAMVRMFKGFNGEKALKSFAAGVEIERAQDYYPEQEDPDYAAKNDAPWVLRFGDAGGRAIISGDTRMRKVPHERLALVQANLIVIFFPSPWAGWRICRKCALLLHWWPVIIDTVKKSKPGFYSVPLTWPDEGKGKLVRLPTEDLKMAKRVRQQNATAEIQKSRRIKKQAQHQETGDLFSGDK